MDQGSRPRLRRAAAQAAAIGIALVAVACGGGSAAPVAAGDTAYQTAAAYARCMRAHGDPNWPDPNSSGQFVKTLANRAAFHAPEFAYRACQHLLPHGGLITPAEQQKIVPVMLKFTACMRSHGIPDFPDPTGSGFEFIPPAGFNPHSPHVQAAQQACRQYMNAAGKLLPPG